MQIVLNHRSGSREGQVEVLSRESILIGRGDENDVALDPFQDPTVSTHHAEIRVEAGSLILYDMGSLNGTYLNGQQVRRAELKPGDLIGLGREGPRLTLEVKDWSATPPASTDEARRSPVTPRSGSTRLEMKIPELGEDLAPKSTTALVIVLSVIAIALLAWFLFA